MIYWGQVPVHVTIGDTEFTTALFPKDGRYLVPVKVAVQRTEAIGEGAIVEVVLRLNAAGRECRPTRLRQSGDRSSRSRWWSDEPPPRTRWGVGGRTARVVAEARSRCQQVLGGMRDRRRQKRMALKIGWLNRTGSGRLVL